MSSRSPTAGPPDECELLPVATAVRGLPGRDRRRDGGGLIANGRVLPAFDTDRPGPWAVFDAAIALLAVYEAFGDGQAKPAVVLPVAAG